MVAEVSGRSAHGDYIAHLHSRARHTVHDTYESRPVIVASTSSPARPHTDTRSTAQPANSFRAPVVRSSPADDEAASSSPQPAPYAQGVAHPDDDDDRLPMRQPAANQAVIGTAQATAAPNSPAAPHMPPPQVVSGFGSEVAVAAPSATGRPGGTRRRDHPVPASALPEDAVPVPLEEREAMTEDAVRPSVLPAIYDRSGRLVMPAPLKGSREVLVHQNTMATSEGLERIQDDSELERLRAEHQLVSFPVSESLRVSEDLPYNRRYARPWTVLFAGDIARDFYARFHQPLQVNSAVRTVSFQLHLQRVNGNAAGIGGDSASPHLTGQAIDLGKRGMSNAQLAWMRAYLLPEMQAGKIDVEEEFQQACFHISVYRQYAYGHRPAHEVAQLSRSAAHNGSDAAGADQP